jgi:hypothetical protein
VFLNDHRAGIIDNPVIDEGKRGVNVTIKGKTLQDLCRWRYSVPGKIADTQYYGYDRFPFLTDPDAPIESIIKHYVDAHMVNPEDTARAISRLVIAADQQCGAAMRWQSRFEPLSAIFKDIGELTGIGYEIRLDLVNEQFVFDIIVGADHTASGANPVIFAPEWGDVSGIKYTDDMTKYANTGYAGGAGEDAARLIQTVYEDDEPRSGWERRETWLDCGSIDTVDDLVYEGKYKLKDKARVRSLSGDVIPAGSFRYGTHWDLGDYVTIQSRRSGIETDVQITEVKESHEKGKFTAVPTFGRRNKNVLDEIRQIGAVR